MHCFIAGCFIKPFTMIIFNFSRSFATQFGLFDIRDIKRRNWERQIARKGKLNIYLKNNFNLLVMNVTIKFDKTDKIFKYDTLLKLIIREVCCL